MKTQKEILNRAKEYLEELEVGSYPESIQDELLQTFIDAANFGLNKRCDWISVEDKLPETNTTVIVKLKSDFICKGVFIECVWEWFIKHNYYNPNDERNSREVTHWRCLD